MRHISILFQIAILFFYVSSAVADDPVQLYYEERIPYAVTNSQGDVNGLTATAAGSAFDQAGIPFQWKKMPFKRQLQTIKFNKKMACGIGWFKTPQREEFALFTGPIYRDKPTITLSNQSNASVARHSDVASLLKDQKLKLLVKDGFSYGSYIDGLIDQFSPHRVVAVGSSNVQMLKMILSGRADYFFVAEEEAMQIIQSSDRTMSEFQRQRYPDMPAGNSRHLACSQQVTPEKVELLNRFLGR